MTFKTITLSFVSKKTSKEVMQIHLKDLNDAICLSAYDEKELKRIEDQLKSSLALVYNLQLKLKGYELIKLEDYK